jgi:RNA polymerase sigma-70 factor (family 1)
MDLAGFKEVFDQHYDPVKNFLYYKLGDINLAEDLVQEVFLKAWEKRDTIRMETVQNLLYTIANNLAINHFNSAKARFEFELREQAPVTQESPHYVLEKDEFAVTLEKAIATLAENQRIVFLMNRIDELTYAEIAQRLGIGVKAVEKRMHEALEALRKTIAHKF